MNRSTERLLALALLILAACLLAACQTTPAVAAPEGLDVHGLDAPCKDLTLPDPSVNSDEDAFNTWFEDGVVAPYTDCRKSKEELVKALKQNRVIKVQ